MEDLDTEDVVGCEIIDGDHERGAPDQNASANESWSGKAVNEAARANIDRDQTITSEQDLISPSELVVDYSHTDTARSGKDTQYLKEGQQRLKEEGEEEAGYHGSKEETSMDLAADAENELLTGGHEASSIGHPSLGTAQVSSPPETVVPLVTEWPLHCDPNYRMPNELNVAVAVDGGVRNIVVKVERSSGAKPFYGGYRQRRTGRTFHHASTQNGHQEKPLKETGHLRTRDTQTFRVKSKTMQTTNECGTQMARKDVHFDNSRDTLKSIGTYQTASEVWRLRLRKTVVIQRFWRGFSARSRIWALHQKKWAQQAKKEKAEQDEVIARERRRQREIHQRMNPTTVRDFEILYAELDQWRQAETKRIKQNEVGEQRQASLRKLLHKETGMLQKIDHLKINAVQEGKERRTKRMLDLMSAPKRWEMRDGEIAEITTPWTTRAKELQELYEALESPSLSIEERLDVLLHLKWTVSEFDCRLTRDIAELVDREADLLSRGRGETSLHPLRQRIKNLFLRFAETPDFNPESTRFLRVPPSYERLTKEGITGLTTVSC